MKTATLSPRVRVPKNSAPVRTGKKSVPLALQIRSLLVPIDFSAPSLSAVEFSLGLVKAFGAQLHLAHVFEPDYPLASMAVMPLIVPELEVGRRVRSHLKDVAQMYLLDLHRENIHARKGRPFEEICRLARERGVDLIVMATRGNTGLRHLALGSTAERVIRYSPCPVLVVRSPERLPAAPRNGHAGPPLFSLRKILVPIDFSDASMKGLSYAKALAKKFQAKLVLLNSVAVQYYVSSDEYARYDLPLLMQQSEEMARQQMRGLVQAAEKEGFEVEGSLQIGHAGQQICTRAQKSGTDLIVTSTHGRTGLKHILIGSTAEYVVRHASCPVLVVPNHPRPVVNGAVAR